MRSGLQARTGAGKDKREWMAFLGGGSFWILSEITDQRSPGPEMMYVIEGGMSQKYQSSRDVKVHALQLTL